MPPPLCPRCPHRAASVYSLDPQILLVFYLLAPHYHNVVSVPVMGIVPTLRGLAASAHHYLRRRLTLALSGMIYYREAEHRDPGIMVIRPRMKVDDTNN